MALCACAVYIDVAQQPTWVRKSPSLTLHDTTASELGRPGWRAEE